MRAQHFLVIERLAVRCAHLHNLGFECHLLEVILELRFVFSHAFLPVTFDLLSMESKPDFDAAHFIFDKLIICSNRAIAAPSGRTSGDLGLESAVLVSNSQLLLVL